MGILVGSASALFLVLLEKAGELRHQNPWLLWLLPLAGILIAYIYRSAGKDSEKGNNLIIDEIHEPGAGVPARMAPVILITTVLTHLFGGSAGREGTAVQIGGSLAGGYQKLFPSLNSSVRRDLLITGVAAGFGGVFGTPLAGAIFSLEVLRRGHLNYSSVIPALAGALVSDWTVTAWGVTHTPYPAVGQGISVHPEPLLLLKTMAASVLFGYLSVLFTELTHFLNRAFRKILPVWWMRPVAGGLLIILLTYLTGTTAYNGLGVSSADLSHTTILSSFKEGGADPFAWFWKTVFTAVTLSSGFKGGEVTPLFYAGASLGNILAGLFHESAPLFAAIGMLAVFAGATNAPLASSVMGIELFGSAYSVYFTLACYIAFFFSGKSGIYLSQKKD